jgi:hypothetical protein
MESGPGLKPAAWAGEKAMPEVIQHQFLFSLTPLGAFSFVLLGVFSFSLFLRVVL